MSRTTSRYDGRHRGRRDLFDLASVPLVSLAVLIGAGSGIATAATSGPASTATPTPTKAPLLAASFIVDDDLSPNRGAGPGVNDDHGDIKGTKKELEDLVTVVAKDDGLMTRPVAGPVTSQFGMRWHPILNYWRLHAGTDFGAACGAPVVASLKGTVVSAGYAGGSGLQVKVDHGTVKGGSLVTTYNHLSSLGVRAGQAIGEGQGLGRVGTTGLSTGCHLHFETLRDGKYVNPVDLLSGRTPPPGVLVPAVATVASRGAARTPVPSPTATRTPTQNPRPSVTSTPSPSGTASPTSSPQVTSSPTESPTSSESGTASPTSSPQEISSPSDTPTPSPSQETP